MKTAISSKSSLRTIFRSQSTFILIAVAFGSLALVQRTQAVNPAPDGGYPGANTAEGDAALFHLTTGVDNTAIGNFALFNNTTANDNTATGFEALADNVTGSNNTAIGAALISNETGSNNTASGMNALFSNDSGHENTATGVVALFSNTTGSENTANGMSTLFSNTTGSANTANGASALQNNTIGSVNTANGVSALQNNTTGSANTANGVNALLLNITGNNNTANGVSALQNNTTGVNNAGFGVNALLSNTTGNRNVALGANSLPQNITGDNNTAQGVNALSNNTVGNNNTANGRAALLRNTTGSSNIALGINAGGNLTTGNSNIDIGNAGVAAEGNTTRIGTPGTQRRAFIAGISGTAVTGSPVVVNANGQLGVAASSEQFKEEIKPMNNVSEAILSLRPVTFRYKNTIDPDRVPQFGLVAEEVAKVNPDLVARDGNGEVYTVRYEAVNAMLLNEFLKEHRKLEQLQVMVTKLQSTLTNQRKNFEVTITNQQNQIEGLTVGLENVSAQVGLNALKTKSRRERGNEPGQGKIIGIHQSIEFDGNVRSTKPMSYLDVRVV